MSKWESQTSAGRLQSPHPLPQPLVVALLNSARSSLELEMPWVARWENRPIEEMATSGGLSHLKQRWGARPERGKGCRVNADPRLAPFPGLASTSRPLPTAPPLFTDQSRKCYMINAPLGPRWAS